MTGRKVLLGSSVVLLTLTLAFGCSLLPRDFGAGPAADGWYIKLQVHAPGAKGITVTDFNVTGLNIQVRDPVGEVKIIDWVVEQGPQTYMVSVKQQGEHQLEVTHSGERNGEAVQAVETTAFQIQPMKITVIEIVPGCVGVIRVGVEGSLDPNAWLYGFWVPAGTMGPDTYVAELRADGTYTWWGDYFASRAEDVVDYGTWWIEGSTFHTKGVWAESAVEITKVSADEFVIQNPGPGTSGSMYRRGTEPGGWVFDQPSIQLFVGDPIQSTLAPLCMDLYRLVAPASAEYAVDCAPFLSNAVYAADQRTKLADEYMRFTLGAGQLVYIIVDSSKGAGAYAIGIVSY